MLELAIAEAYRPRPSQHPRLRPHQPPSQDVRLQNPAAEGEKLLKAASRGPSFATNPNASTRVSNVSLHALSAQSSRPGYAISTSSTATGRPRRSFAFHRFATRWTATPSTLAEAETKEQANEAEGSVERIDSLISPPEHTITLTPFSKRVILGVGREDRESEKKEKSNDKAIEEGQDKAGKISTTKREDHKLYSLDTALPKVPKLPPAVPLPPQEELEPFDTTLQSAINDLHILTKPAASASHNASKPTPDPALMALHQLSYLSDLSACIAVSWAEYWALITHAVHLLTSVLPSDHISVKNTLLRCLLAIAQAWEKEQEKGGRGMVDIASLAGEVIDQLIEERNGMEKRVGDVLGAWIASVSLALPCSKDEALARMMQGGLHTTCTLGPAAVFPPRKHTREDGRATLHVLALELSSVVMGALIQSLAALPDISIMLSTLSTSAPHPFNELRSETPLPPLQSQLQSRLRTSTYSPTALGSLAQCVHVLLLLYAQSIDANGDVSCRQGALSAAVCVKTLGKGRVVVVCSCDDFVALRAEEREGGEGGGLGVGERGDEMVPARLVDAYITEEGVLGLCEIEALVRRDGELEGYGFGERG